MNYAYIGIEKKAGGLYISYISCNQSDKGTAEAEKQVAKINSGDLYFKVSVEKGAVCTFRYSTDGIKFIEAGEKFTATPGRWIGAKMGFFCLGTQKTNDAGFAEIDWFRINTL